MPMWGVIMDFNQINKNQSPPSEAMACSVGARFIAPHSQSRCEQARGRDKSGPYGCILIIFLTCIITPVLVNMYYGHEYDERNQPCCPAIVSERIKAAGL